MKYTNFTNIRLMRSKCHILLAQTSKSVLFRRWRTSAVEINVGNFVIGKSIYTNEPDRDRKGYEHDKNYTSKLWGKAKLAYPDSKVFSGPLNIGVKKDGKVTRFGINHPMVQDVTQNGWHSIIGSPFFYTPYGEYSTAYRYSGYYNPYSLYYR